MTPLALNLVIISLGSVAISLAQHPGMKSRITPDGIEFIKEVGVVMLEAKLKQRTVPQYCGSSGMVSYCANTMYVSGIWITRTNVKTASDCWLGISTLITVSIHGNYEYKVAGIFSGSGTFDATISNAELELTMMIGIDGSGHPAVSTGVPYCTFNAGSVDVDLHGQPRSRSEKVSRMLKQSLNEMGCQKIVDAVNNQLESELQTLKMQYDIRHVCYLDYSLVLPPSLNSSTVDLGFKGEVFAYGSRSEASLPIPRTPSEPENSRMFYVWLTDYVANSAGYALHNADHLRYIVTQNNIPEGSKLSLNTSEFPINTLFPTVSQRFPGMLMQLHMFSIAPPMMNTTKSKVTTYVKGNIDVYVTQSNMSLAYLFTLGANISLSFQVGTNNQHVTWKAKYENCNVSLVKSAIGDIKIAKLKTMLPMAMKTFVIPSLNKKGKVGVAILSYDGVALTATSIKQGQGFLEIGTNATYVQYVQKLNLW